MVLAVSISPYAKLAKIFNNNFSGLIFRIVDRDHSAISSIRYAASSFEIRIAVPAIPSNKPRFELNMLNHPLHVFFQVRHELS